jgi:hypothetical protein
MTLVNSDFRIEKERLPVTVVTASGERLSGDIFVQGYARNRLGRERPIDVLNDPEPYFALALPDESTLLVAKRRVRDVTIPNSDDVPTGATRAPSRSRSWSPGARSSSARCGSRSPSSVRGCWTT